MKVMLVETEEVRKLAFTEEITSCAMEAVLDSDIELLTSVDAILISAEYPGWEEYLAAAGRIDLPCYVIAKPTLDVLQAVKAAGKMSGLISTFDEGAMRKQVRQYLQRVASGQGPIIRPGDGIVRLGQKKQGNNKPGREEDMLKPSPELMARRMKKQKEGVSVRDQVISIYSPKGGVGKSTLSVNIAYTLATTPSLKARVILVDLDTSFGNVASILGLPQKANLVNWVRGEFRDNLEELVYVEPKSGMHVLMSPPDPVDAGNINYRVVDKMLSILAKRYDFVVVDTNPALRALHKAVFEWADTVLLVSTTQMPTLRDCKNMELVFKKMQIPLEKVKLIVNMVPKKANIRLREVLREFQFDILGQIPEDPGVRELENANGIACISGKCRQFAQAHYVIVNKFLGGSIVNKPKGFSFGALFRRA